MVSLMDLDARFDGRSIVSQHVQSGPIGDHLDLDLLAEVAVMLSYIADVIEREIHDGGVIDVDMYRRADAAAFDRRGWSSWRWH